MKSRPNRLYRYMDTGTAWECLNESTLAFTPPNLFNDPFDTNIAVDLALTAEDLRDFYAKHAPEWPGGVSVSEERFVEMHLEHPERFQKVYLRAKDSFTQHARGVACFTELWNDPLMWAHYADKHRGVMIGFDIEHPDFSEVRFVDYSNTRPVHRQLGSKLDGKEMVKSDVWEREKEWRLSADLAKCEIRMTATHKPVYVQRLSRDSFASITFGCRTSQEFMTAVALSLKRWNLAECELKEMKLCDFTYELEPKAFRV
jgi:hypothetical protein